MVGLSQRFMRLLAWRPSYPPPVRWFLAGLLCLASFLVRLKGGLIHGANPVLAFFPTILIVTLFLGWREAVAVLAVLVALGIHFFLPKRLFLLPVAWTFVGVLNIAIIAGLKSLAAQLAESNDKQRILFQELQHRVANTLHTVVGNIELARRKIDSDPAQAAGMMGEIVQRLIASADVHRRLHDPALFQRGLQPVLQDAVASVIDRRSTRLTFDIEPLDLSFDQMSTITMLVIEAANNAQKHVFLPGRGSTFSISLKSAPNGTARLVMSDDGPGPIDAATDRVSLGMSIAASLAKQIQGTLSVSSAGGHQITVWFPLAR